MQSLSLSSANSSRYSNHAFLSSGHHHLCSNPRRARLLSPSNLGVRGGAPLNLKNNLLPASPSTITTNASASISTPLCRSNKTPVDQSFWTPRTDPISRRPNTGLLLPPFLCGNPSNSLDTSSINGGSGIRLLESFGETMSRLFPLWVALGCWLGLKRPSSFAWVEPQWTIWGITLTMLGMGMTLTFDDLKKAFSMRKELLLGFFLQYTVMPLSAFLISKLLMLPSYYAAGLVLVGCCPGGTASNIVTYIAGGNVALSVLMTAASTLSAVVMTPFLTAQLAGQYVKVEASALLLSTLQVMFLPVLVGALLNHYFKSLVKFVSTLMPPFAVATVAILCGKAISQCSAAILVSGQQVVVAAILLHVSGFFFGYIISRENGIDVSSSRTISIEVGMQNSVLGVVLASQHFGDPLTAVPCAVSSVCHSIIGSALAGMWRRHKSAQTTGSEMKTES